MKSKLLYLLLFTMAAFAQDRQVLRGKVTIAEDPGSYLFVINTKTGEESKTDIGGNFSIMAKSGDALAVYSDNTEVREFTVSADSFKETPYTLSVNYKAYELDEVEINKYKKINSESLGLVPKGQKQYTPAEKKLRTAGDFKPIMLLGIIAGGMPLDPVINAINGRTKMLKGALASERKEFLIEKAGTIYTDQEITDDLGIPKEYTKGFIFYIVEDKEFASALNAGDMDRAKFLMAALALKYLTLIKGE